MHTNGRTSPRIPREPGPLALLCLLGSTATVVLTEPLVDLAGLPESARYLPALTVPAAALLVALVVAAQWRQQPRAVRVPTACLAALLIVTLVSWLAGSPRTMVSLGLAGVSLLLMPLALYVAAVAARSTWAPGDEVVVWLLRLVVLAQLVAGILQYAPLDARSTTPYAPDLIQGTTASANLWPVFALPASFLLAWRERGALRLLWPFAATLLAVYAEAKAALLVWVPLAALGLVLVIFDSLRAPRGAGAGGAGRPRWRLPSSATALRGALVVLTVVLLGLGLRWSPSLQGPWEVLVGHSRDAEVFITQPELDATADSATLRDAVPVVLDELSSSPAHLLLGLGPANSVSRAADVLARQGIDGTSLPQPGPVAQQLLGIGEELQFQDAQSSLLGVLGDLGVAGALLFLLLVLTAAWSLLQSRDRRARAALLQVLGLLAGTWGGAVLLDWPEQAPVAVVVALCALAAVRAPGGPHSRWSELDEQVPRLAQ